MVFFFFNDTATTEIYTLSLHDALPISRPTPFSSALTMSISVSPATAAAVSASISTPVWPVTRAVASIRTPSSPRSEEHTSELQSQSNLVCRLLLEKKKKQRSLDHPQHF